MIKQLIFLSTFYISHKISIKTFYHCAPLIWWSIHWYQCLWSVGRKGHDSNMQKRILNTYTIRLD